MALQMTWQPNLRKRKLESPPLGLKNLGNTCYLNSVLQCLTYTPPLANFCLRGLHTRLCDNSRECPFCILERRISRSLSIDGPIDAPAKIESCIQIFAEHFQCGRQEDAHEFLRYVIDACHSTCLKFLKSASSNGSNSIVRDIFGGSLLSQVKCLSCSAESNKIDEIMDLSLDLYQSNSLIDALKRFFCPEILNGTNKYCCSSCKKLSEARKQIFVLEAPNVLVIQLKRFEGMNGAKINRDIAFQEVLLLSSFMWKASQDPNPEYNLFGSIVHSGNSSESGHYYAYIKDPSGRWYCCNDAYVSLSSTQTVLAEKVYILFFIRTREKSKNIKSVTKPIESRPPIPKSTTNGTLRKKNLDLIPKISNEIRPLNKTGTEEAVDVVVGKRKADDLLPGGLEKFKETIAAEASRKLRSCGWADEVQDFMRVHKRQCVEAVDKTEIKRVLIADAKKAFTSKLPNSIRQSLIDRLKLLSLGKSVEKEG